MPSLVTIKQCNDTGILLYFVASVPEKFIESMRNCLIKRNKVDVC